jgi:hypothetical protein
MDPVYEVSEKLEIPFEATRRPPFYSKLKNNIYKCQKYVKKSGCSE